MEKSQQLTPDQSLELINEMILKAKQSFSKVSFYFLLWGMLLFIAGIVEYYLDRVVHYEYSYVGWPVVGFIGGIIASIHGAAEGKKQGVMSYTDKVFMFLWSAFVVTLVLLIVGAVANDSNPGSYIIIMTGLPTFVSGGIMRFKPLIVGGLIFWAIGIFSFFFLDEYRSLLFSLAILFGYIIPGIMLKRSEDGSV